MTKQTIRIHQPKIFCPIYIGNKIIIQGLSKYLKNFVSHSKIIFITTPFLKKTYWAIIKKNLDPAWNIQKIIIQDKEKNKNLKTAQKIIDSLIHLKADRQTTLVALGGGVVGDLTGFVSSVFMRGIPFVSIPTSLLSQVDSSLGGKCGVNTPLGKNLIGSFYHPKAVFSDIFFLQTLSPGNFKSGLAEVIKYALIQGDRSTLWDLLHKQKEKILQRNSLVLKKIVYECVKIKRAFIEQDEKDFSRRHILNLGHTLGHALETHTQYRYLSHGEAVAQGLYFAQDLSYKKGLCNFQALKKTCDLLQSYGFFKLPSPTKFGSSVLDHIQNDKKRKGSLIPWILIQEPGKIKQFPISISEVKQIPTF